MKPKENRNGVLSRAMQLDLVLKSSSGLSLELFLPFVSLFVSFSICCHCMAGLEDGGTFTPEVPLGWLKTQPKSLRKNN